MKPACMRRPSTLIRIREFFPASQWRQLLPSSIWVRCLVLSSDFHCKQNDGSTVLQHIPCNWFRLFFGEKADFIEVCIKCEECDGVLSFRHFPYNENPTRALNTSLKCYLSPTYAIDRREKIHTCVWRFKVASCKRSSLKSTRFSRSDRGILQISHMLGQIWLWVNLCAFDDVDWKCSYMGGECKQRTQSIAEISANMGIKTRGRSRGMNAITMCNVHRVGN